jgi:hypothetical protein
LHTFIQASVSQIILADYIELNHMKSPGSKNDGRFDSVEDQKGWVFADTASMMDLQLGFSELQAFAESVVTELILFEERTGRNLSPLRFFCRVDVAVVYNPQSQQYQYIVNEVARNMCGLFAYKKSNPFRLFHPMVENLEATLQRQSNVSIHQV